jgi:hypothetical protein
MNCHLWHLTAYGAVQFTEIRLPTTQVELTYWYTVGSNGGTLHLEAKIKVSSDNTPCHNVKRYRRFERYRCLLLQSQEIQLDNPNNETVEITNKMQTCNRIYYSNVY